MMRRAMPALVLLAALFLAGCEIVVSGGGVWPDDLTISNAGYLTDAEATIDGVDRYVICDDRLSDLTYFFDYEGALDEWSSYLQGVTTGVETGHATFTPSSPGVRHTADDVMVTYSIHSGVAPLANQEALTPQGIVVVPAPEVIGYTRLYLRIASTSSARQLVSRDIPVIANCLG